MGMKLYALFTILYAIDASFPRKNLHKKQSDYFGQAAVVTNSFDCTNIGLNILRAGGTAADSAIASLFCEGVSNPQSMGLGGGFLLTIFKKSSGVVEVLNARECAPALATKNMFDPSCLKTHSLNGLSVGVPGELKGYWELHKKYGKLPWEDLVKPTVKLLRRGVYVSSYLSKIIAALETEIAESPSLKAIFLNRDTGKLYREGELMYRPKFVDTLCKIAAKGPDVLYNGVLTDGFVKDIEDQGGIVTKEDLKKYKPRWMVPLSTTVCDYLIYSVPSPGAGSFLLMILDVISKVINDSKPINFWHRLIETWKFAYGLKSQQSGPDLASRRIADRCYNSTVSDFIRNRIRDGITSEDPSHYFGVYEMNEDYGTSHLNVLAPNGDAVAVTSTINLVFGAFFASPSTGIILNNQVLDFSMPNHHHEPWRSNPSNFVKPHRQPVSSMCPTLVLNPSDNSVRMLIGASGGFKILTGTSLVAIRHLLLGEDLQEAVDQPRLHHQLVPMKVEYEEGFPVGILRGLREKGHAVKRTRKEFGEARCAEGSRGLPMVSAVNAIAVQDKEIRAAGDKRRGAFASGY